MGSCDNYSTLLYPLAENHSTQVRVRVRVSLNSPSLGFSNFFIGHESLLALWLSEAAIEGIGLNVSCYDYILFVPLSLFYVPLTFFEFILMLWESCFFRNK